MPAEKRTPMAGLPALGGTVDVIARLGDWTIKGA
jgi:hypothetical protein